MTIKEDFLRLEVLVTSGKSSSETWPVYNTTHAFCRSNQSDQNGNMANCPSVKKLPSSGWSLRRSFGLVEELTILVLAWLIPNFSSIPAGSKLRSSTKKRGPALSNHTLISPETQAPSTKHSEQIFQPKVTWKQFPVVPLHRPNATLKVSKVTKSHQVPPSPTRSHDATLIQGSCPCPKRPSRTFGPLDTCGRVWPSSVQANIRWFQWLGF